jgi:hypothetical protein
MTKLEMEVPPVLEIPRVTDNDSGEISITYKGQQLRSWSYNNDRARRLGMVYAREYIEGWCDGHDAGHDLGYDNGHREASKEV